MSIKEIAEKAGVSPATVSRVLNNPNYKCSSPELRNQIWKYAIDMDYVPNEAARNLRLNGKAKKKTYYINVLMTRMGEEQSDPFFSELLHIVESEIHKHSCILSKVWYMPIFSNDAKCRKQDLNGLVADMYKEVEGKSDGLIIIGKCNKDALKALLKKYRNVVSVNRNSTNYTVDEILCDGRKISAMATEYLVSLGHKRLGYVGKCRGESRYLGFTDVLHKYDIEVEADYIVETKQTEKEGFDAMKNFLQSDDFPTGIYCANDITAVGMLKCLNRYKNLYYTPSIISSDDIEEAQFTKPMLTTVRLPKEEMGKFAMNLLMDRIQGGHESIVKMELEGKLIKRNSCFNVEDGGVCEYYI